MDDCREDRSPQAGEQRQSRWRPRRPFHYLAGAVAACALLATAACGSSSGSGSGSGSGSNSSTGSLSASVANGSTDTEVKGCPHVGGTLTVDLDEDVLADLDPSYEPTAVSYRVTRTVFDSLVYETPKGSFSPWLASSWTITNAGKTYIFNIRKGATFSDGTPVNADAVKFTFDRIESPSEGSLFAISLLGPYKDSVVLSPYKLEVNFKTPYPGFLEAASQEFLGIVSPTAVNKDGGLTAAGAAKFGALPVGSGPFKLTENKVNTQIVEVRRQNYDWGPAALTHQGAACVSKIVFNEVPQASTRIGELQSGQVQAAETILPPDYKTVKRDSNLDLYVVPGAGADYQYEINTQEYPWNSTQMRIALRDAINIPAMLQAIYQGEYTRAWGPIMPKTAFYDSAVQHSWSYDPAKSKKILSSEGWKMGSGGYLEKDGKQLTISFVGASPDRELRQEVSTYVAQYLAKVGIKMTITNYTGLSGESVLESGNYGITATSFITASPDIMYDFFATSEISTTNPAHLGENGSRLDNAQVNAWVTQAESTDNTKVETTDWDKVQMYVVKNAVVIPIELEPFILATSKSVHGLAFDIRDYPMYYGVWLSK